MSPLESWVLICNLGAIVYLSASLALRLAEKGQNDA